MNQLQLLRSQLVELPVAPGEDVVNQLVATYLAAREQISDLVNVQADAKRGIRQVIDQTGQTDWNVDSGIVLCPADATIITYDAGALDRLAALSHAFRRKVYPFRSQTVRAGGIRINPK
jgi:hypothetical protein